MVRFWGVFSWNGQLQGIRWESGGSLNSANSFLVWNCHEILMEDCIVGKPRKRKSPTDVACDAISGPSNGDYGLKKVFVSDYVGKWQLWFLFILRSLRLTETQPKHNRPQICWPLGMWMQMTSEIYYLYQMYLLFFSVLMFRQLLIGLWKICWTNDLSPSAYQLVLFMAFLSTNWRKINSKWGHSLLRFSRGQLHIMSIQF